MPLCRRALGLGDVSADLGVQIPPRQVRLTPVVTRPRSQEAPMSRRIAVIPAVLLLLALAAAPARAARNAWRQVPTWNIAHQGGEDEFPSNTLYAFRRALAAGANMLELDIGVTKDGQVVVMHDTTVDRITNGHGTVASKTLAQIQRLDGAYWF